MQIDEDCINKVASKERNKGKILGLCHGCFDIIHHGHVDHFKIARDQCDVLFVSVTADTYVNKGKGRPYNSLKNRMVVLEALKCVDYVFESNHLDAMWSLGQVQPEYFFKGSEYKRGNKYNTNFDIEKSYAKSLGVEVFFTNGKTSSSTMLLNKLKEHGLAVNQI